MNTTDKLKQMQVFTHVAFAQTFHRTSEEIKCVCVFLSHGKCELYKNPVSDRVRHLLLSGKSPSVNSSLL